MGPPCGSLANWSHLNRHLHPESWRQSRQIGERLAEIAAKLRLDHPEDMESIAAKAIRDGVIDATLDHAAGVLVSKEQHDVYSTLEPQAAFHKRITFCLNVHNDAVKAMSYPPDAHRDQLPDAEMIKERQREENELAESLAEDDYD